MSETVGYAIVSPVLHRRQGRGFVPNGAVQIGAIHLTARCGGAGKMGARSRLLRITPEILALLPELGVCVKCDAREQAQAMPRPRRGVALGGWRVGYEHREANTASDSAPHR